MNGSYMARAGRFSRRKYRAAVIILPFLILWTCASSACAGALGVTQISLAEAVEGSEDSPYLFLDIPYGISPEACEAQLMKRFGIGYQDVGEGDDVFFASILDTQAFDLWSDAAEVRFTFRKYKFNQAQVSFDAIPFDEEDGYRSLYAELLSRYGNPTDACLVRFGEVPNITYYFFPKRNGAFDVERAFYWMSTADENLGMVVNFHNVALCLYKGESKQTVYTMSLEYDETYFDTSCGKRIDYILNRK